MPTCGRCKKTNVSAGSIRACYNGQPNPHHEAPAKIKKPGERAFVATEMSRDDEEAEAARRLGALMTKVPVGEKSDSPLWPASESQKSYVLDLQDGRILPAEYAVHTRVGLDKMERDEVSSLITMLKTFPYKNKTNGEGKREYNMPEGRYALMVNGEVWFFEVQKPTKGRWAGYTFIKRLIGAPGDYRKVPMTPSERSKYLSKIDADPKAAAIMFGKETETCYRCHSPLTVPESIARSMGPKCAAKAGW